MMKFGLILLIILLTIPLVLYVMGHDSTMWFLQLAIIYGLLLWLVYNVRMTYNRFKKE